TDPTSEEVTFRVAGAPRTRDPSAPCTVSAKLPTSALAGATNEISAGVWGTTFAVQLGEQETPAGRPVTDTATGAENPLAASTEIESAPRSCPPPRSRWQAW